MLQTLSAKKIKNGRVKNLTFIFRLNLGMSSRDSKIFRFKQFEITQDRCAMKVGTDGVLLGAWSDVSAAKTILDIGTGTGIIALMLAQRTTIARVDAVEVDEASYKQAKSNFAKSKWDNNLSVLHISIQNYSASIANEYDLIVCNPPFFSGGTLSSYQDKNTVRHTIKLSHQDLIKSTRTLLSREGKFSVILPLIEGLRFVEIAESYGLHCTKKTEVKPKKIKPIERLLLEFSKIKKPMINDELIIQKEGRNDWTDAYISLTDGFHLGE